MSDLHLGEEDSVFMELKNDQLGLSRKITQRVKELVQKELNGNQVDYLILAGDILELSLATRVRAFESFRDFLQEFETLFKHVIYIPGNHDHHIWTALQEEAKIFHQIKSNKPVKEYYHAFIPKIRPDGIFTLEGEQIKPSYGDDIFLYKLLSKTKQKDKIMFLIAYPNVYLDLEEKILVTHGHFFEDAWTLFTDAIPNSLNLSYPSYKLLEQINSPFTEFGWYHLGQAGKLSELMEELWDNIHTGRNGTIDKLSDEITHYLDERLKFRPKNKKGLKAFIDKIIGASLEYASDQWLNLNVTILKQLVLSQISPEDPKTPGSELRHAQNLFRDPRKKAKVETYLNIAVNSDEFALDALMFGHTHTPWIPDKYNQGELTIGNKSIKTYNTGGWVADLLEPVSLRGSRPFILGIKDDGSVENIDIPWPSKEMFEQAVKDTKDKMHIKAQIHKIMTED